MGVLLQLKDKRAKSKPWKTLPETAMRFQKGKSKTLENYIEKKFS
jgi:hypothetical protein